MYYIVMMQNLAADHNSRGEYDVSHTNAFADRCNTTAKKQHTTSHRKKFTTNEKYHCQSSASNTSTKTHSISTVSES